MPNQETIKSKVMEKKHEMAKKFKDPRRELVHNLGRLQRASAQFKKNHANDKELAF